MGRIESIARISRETDKFPAGGAAVAIEDGVTTTKGHYGDLSGRGTIVFVRNGDGEIKMMPESASDLHVEFMSQPVVSENPDGLPNW